MSKTNLQVQFLFFKQTYKYGTKFTARALAEYTRRPTNGNKTACK